MKRDEIIEIYNEIFHPDMEVYWDVRIEEFADRLEQQPEVQLTADEQYVLDIAVQLLTSCKDGEVMIQRNISPNTIDGVANMIEKIGIQAHHPQPISEERICEWTNDEDYEYYETSCGEAYSLIDGTLAENKHLYCPFCGGKIKELTNNNE